MIGLFKLARESGYTLRLIPGTPEETRLHLIFRSSVSFLPRHERMREVAV